MNHWSNTRWTSSGVALLILASLVVFGAWRCGKPVQADEIDELTHTVNESFAAGVHMGKLCNIEAFNEIAACCDEAKANLIECSKAAKNVVWPK